MTSIAVVVEGWLRARSEVATPRNKLQTTPKVGDLVEYQGRLLRVWGVRPRRGDRLEVHAEELTWRSGHNMPQTVSADLVAHLCQRCSVPK